MILASSFVASRMRESEDLVRQKDLDLANLPGQMPALKDVKIIPYDEDGWGARRAETLQKIQDLVRQTR